MNDIQRESIEKIKRLHLRPLADDVDRYIRRRLEDQHLLMVAELQRCESPIEQLLLAAILFDFRRFQRRVYRFIRPQQTVQACGHTYRVDIAIVGHEDLPSMVKVAVECDGHDYHERTKEQAQSDKERDRNLQADGWTVMRFTGSEITADPDLCASEVRNMIYRVSEKGHASHELQPIG